jgi:uncharacterized protein
MNTPSDQMPPTEPPASAGEGPSAEERQWAMAAHLSALAGALLTGVWMGWGCFIGPLIIWLVKKDTMPFVDDQAKEALNFNITFAIVGIVLFLLTVMTFLLGSFITVPLAIIAGIGWLILTIVASIKANDGVAYRYPICLRLIK